MVLGLLACLYYHYFLLRPHMVNILMKLEAPDQFTRGFPQEDKEEVASTSFSLSNQLFASPFIIFDSHLRFIMLFTVKRHERSSIEWKEWNIFMENPVYAPKKHPASNPTFLFSPLSVSSFIRYRADTVSFPFCLLWGLFLGVWKCELVSWLLISAPELNRSSEPTAVHYVPLFAAAKTPSVKAVLWSLFHDFRVIHSWAFLAEIWGDEFVSGFLALPVDSAAWASLFRVRIKPEVIMWCSFGASLRDQTGLLPFCVFFFASRVSLSP